MKNNVDSRVKAFIQEVEKFSARWHQLKPGDDALDGDKKKCEAAVQVIKDKRQEFAELEKTRETLVQVFYIINGLLFFFSIFTTFFSPFLQLF